MMRLRTPLAWLSLTHDRRRYALSVLGVAFAVILMFVEMGFLNGMYDSQSDLVSQLDADLLVINRLKEDLLPTRPISRTRLRQALADPGVERASPLYIEEYTAMWKDFDRGGLNKILALGFEPSHPPFNFPEIERHLEALKLPGTALVDSGARDLYGSLEPGTVAELAGRRIRIVGTFRVGPDFRNDGTILMSARNFQSYFPDPATGHADPDRIEMGLLKLIPGEDVAAVQKRLEARLPEDVNVVTREQMVERIQTFWRTYQPIGAVFGLGAAVGFIIGVTICYQILFVFVNDHIAQFATLKAMGYRPVFLVRVVLAMALYLAISGFVPGLAVSAASYGVLESMTGIRMWLTSERVLMVLLLTIAMCLFSAALALRKVLRSDPADLF